MSPRAKRCREPPEFAMTTTRHEMPSPLKGTRIMGVLNVTPDSFSDGGRIGSPEEAFDRAAQMIAEGADILDVGGESSRPGAQAVSPEEEERRVLPVVAKLAGLGTKISVDTYRARTAQLALEHGASMVNDITALRGDAGMGEVVAQAGCECVLMHMRGTPETMQDAPVYDDVIDDIRAFFEERMAAATKCGIAEDAIWLDPGFGFGKTAVHNLCILRRLAEFKSLGRPILIGTSNKSTIGTALGTEVDDRMEGTAATVAIGICQGADCVRVHDVRTMARVARMSDAIMGKESYV